jgi:hypothetical protein
VVEQKTLQGVTKEAVTREIVTREIAAMVDLVVPARIARIQVGVTSLGVVIRQVAVVVEIVRRVVVVSRARVMVHRRARRVVAEGQVALLRLLLRVSPAAVVVPPGAGVQVAVVGGAAVAVVKQALSPLFPEKI